MEVTRGKNLHKVGWKDGLLTVSFRNRPTIYVYSGVAREDADKLFRSPFPDALFYKLVKKNGWTCTKIGGIMALQLRPYQQQCLDISLERYQQGVNRQLAVLATGAGKTCIAASIRSHHGFTKRTLFTVHREELAVQAAEKLLAWNPGLMVSVEMAEHKHHVASTFVVASVPTIGRKGSPRLKKFDPDEYDCVIGDEIHHGMATTFQNVYRHFGLMEPNPKGPLFLGITATPNRSDGQGLRALFDELIFDYGMDKAIADGYLVDIRCWRISTKTNLDGVHVQAGDFAVGELADTVNTPERNGLVVKAWHKHAQGKKTIAFTVDVQHALDLAAAFQAFGVNAEAIWGEDDNRSEKIARFRHGGTTVATNCNLMTEGFDDPETECIVLARPTKSALLLTQQIGRGTRLPAGRDNICDVAEGQKDCLIVLDCVDVSTRHQLVTVPSLLGLPKNLDMKGEKYRVAKDKLERVAKEFPTANLADLKDLTRLDQLSQQVDLFRVKFPPEISQLTELAWRQQGDGYVLPVMREKLTLSRDLRDEWWVRGFLNDRPVEIHVQNLAGAFNAADRVILDNGNLRRLLSRDAHWRDKGPTPGQVQLCRKLRLEIPAGATRGMVSAAIDARMGGRRV